MLVAIIVEGKTEKAFMPSLRKFIQTRVSKGHMPKLQAKPFFGRIPKEEKLKREVENLLSGPNKFNFVLALTDVYTGTADFSDAADARAKMRDWVGPNERFYAHAAQCDFEAWLLPYWATIQELAGHNKTAPHGEPEKVNHNRPPCKHMEEIFEIGKCRDSYSKPRDAARILQKNDLLVSAHACPELRALLNTIIGLCDGDLIP